MAQEMKRAGKDFREPPMLKNLPICVWRKLMENYLLDEDFKAWKVLKNGLGPFTYDVKFMEKLEDDERAKNLPSFLMMNLHSISSLNVLPPKR